MAKYNPYFESLKRLYNKGLITADEVHNVVTRGWITEEEYQEIVSQYAAKTLTIERTI